MRKLTAVVAAMTLAGGMAAATAADAQPRYYHRNNDTGAAIAAGVAGLALGAALGSRGSTSYSYGYGYPSYSYGYAQPSYGYYDRGRGRRYYDRRYYDRRYRAPPRAYYAPPRLCTYWAYDHWGRAYPAQRYC